MCNGESSGKSSVKKNSDIIISQLMSVSESQATNNVKSTGLKQKTASILNVLVNNMESFVNSKEKVTNIFKILTKF